MSRWTRVRAAVAGLVLAIAAPAGSQEAPLPEGRPDEPWVGGEARPARQGGGAAGGPTLRVRKGDDLEAAMAEARLKAGRPILAVEMARTCLEKRPDAVACRRVLLRSLAAAGRCGDALPGLEALRREGEWSAELALSEGLCRLRTSDAAAAREAFLEAHLLKDKSSLYRYEAAMASVRRFEFEDFGALMDDLRAGDDEWMVPALELWRAVETGDPAADLLLGRADAAGESLGKEFSAQVAMLSCRRWLDLGDPLAADLVSKRGVRQTMQQTRLLACRAEALRRQGWVLDALELASRPWNEASDTPALDAVRVRALVDLGRLAEAQEAAARLPRQDDPDLLAARWYLAAAQGSPDAERWARRYDAVPQPPGRERSRYAPLAAPAR